MVLEIINEGTDSIFEMRDELARNLDNVMEKQLCKKEDVIG